MRLEFISIEEANDLLNQLIENHPHAIFVTNNDFKIEYFNKSFQKLARQEKYEILGKEFCELFGCTFRGKPVNSDSKFCNNCRMCKLLAGSSVSELDIIREFNIHNEVITKHFYFTTTRVVMNGKKLRIVVMEDRTSKH